MKRSSGSTPVVCDVLTGYLGSGKTTLLNRYLRTRGEGTAVIVNEVGEIGVDQLVLREVSENVVLLDSGCLCCSVSGTLRETLLDLGTQAARAGLPLTRVVIETTGLAEPVPILHALLGDRLLTGRFELGRVVTTVDRQHALAQLEAGRETARQIAVADVLVTTKRDLADAASMPLLEAALNTLNPRARRIDAHADNALDAVFDAPAIRVGDSSADSARQAARTHDHDDHHAHVHVHGIGAQSFWVDFTTSWPGIAAWWNLLMQRYDRRLLRCKGVLGLDQAASPILIQGVGNHFHPPLRLARWPEGDARGRVTLIGEGLERDWLEASLQALRIDTSGLLPRTLEELAQVGGTS
ncbi:CobW family GTP-binding protein [Caballeronia glathei]|nr:GTP-binding protein [Caballeronia glathei]